MSQADRAAGSGGRALRPIEPQVVLLLLLVSCGAGSGGGEGVPAGSVTVFERVDFGLLPAVTSTLTLLETLVGPLRAGDEPLANAYEVLLSRSRGLRLIELDRDALRLAAMIRARVGLKTPDALQVAAGLQERCTALLTNDRQIPSIGEMRTLQLRDYH